ncbi:hypothetical protein [Actinophytocola sediminis]
MALTVDRLIAHGLTVVQCEDRKTTWMIETHGCGWELVVSDSGSVELVYWPRDQASRDRERRADLAALLLTGKPRVNRLPPENVSAAEMAWIGFSLRGNGFDVDIHAYTDPIGLDCVPSIVVRVDTYAKAVVYVEEDGSLLYCREYAPEHVVYDPVSQRAYFPDLPAVADAIVSTVLPAITGQSLGRRGQCSEGSLRCAGRSDGTLRCV